MCFELWIMVALSGGRGLLCQVPDAGQEKEKLTAALKIAVDTGNPAPGHLVPGRRPSLQCLAQPRALSCSRHPLSYLTAPSLQVSVLSCSFSMHFLPTFRPDALLSAPHCQQVLQAHFFPDNTASHASLQPDGQTYPSALIPSHTSN